METPKFNSHGMSDPYVSREASNPISHRVSNKPASICFALITIHQAIGVKFEETPRRGLPTDMDTSTIMFSLFDWQKEEYIDTESLDLLQDFACYESFILHDKLIYSCPNSPNCYREGYVPRDVGKEKGSAEIGCHLFYSAQHLRGVKILLFGEVSKVCPDGVYYGIVSEDVEDEFSRILTKRTWLQRGFSFFKT